MERYFAYRSSLFWPPLRRATSQISMVRLGAMKPSGYIITSLKWSSKAIQAIK